jgi:hypothetical protein
MVVLFIKRQQQLKLSKFCSKNNNIKKKTLSFAENYPAQ